MWLKHIDMWHKWKNALLHQFQVLNSKYFWHWWRSWCSLFFHFQTGQISEERRKTRTVNANFHFHRMGKTSATCCSSHELASTETWPVRTISSFGCMVLVLARNFNRKSRSWKKRCRKGMENEMWFSMPGDRDVVEPCSNLMQMGEWLFTSNFNCWAQNTSKKILKLTTGIISWYPWFGNAPVALATFPCLCCWAQELPEATKNQEEGRWNRMEMWFPSWCLHAWWYRCGWDPTQMGELIHTYRVEFHLLSAKKNQHRWKNALLHQFQLLNNKYV